MARRRLGKLEVSEFGAGCMSISVNYARDAISRQRRLLGENDPDLAASLLELARIQAARGEFDDARAAARQALKIWSNTVFVDPAILLDTRQLAEAPRRLAAA